MAWAAAFFAAASAVLERMLELASPFIPWWDYPTGDAIAQKKADRGYALITITAFLGVLASAASGLYLADAIGLSLTRWSDILLTGIAIGAGTKAIHEMIKSLEKAKGAGTARARRAAQPVRRPLRARGSSAR